MWSFTRILRSLRIDYSATHYCNHDPLIQKYSVPRIPSFLGNPFHFVGDVVASSKPLFWWGGETGLAVLLLGHAAFSPYRYPLTRFVT